MVAAGKMDAAKAWPELAGDMNQSVPERGADLTQFEWEEATEESYASDIAAIDALTAEKHITVPEPPAERPARVSVPDLEWT